MNQPVELSAVYPELRKLARSYFLRERSTLTLQPTAIVHEAFIRMSHSESWFQLDRNDLICLAARTMRLVLVDHARARNSKKRGGHYTRRPLDDVLDDYESQSTNLTCLHDALERLAIVDSGMARLVDLRFFGGLTEADAARVLSMSPRTAQREWTLARQWLRNVLAH